MMDGGWWPVASGFGGTVTSTGFDLLFTFVCAALLSWCQAVQINDHVSWNGGAMPASSGFARSTSSPAGFHG